MKTTCLLPLLAIVFAVNAQTKAPNSVTNTFAKKFPDATHVK